MEVHLLSGYAWADRLAIGVLFHEKDQPQQAYLPAHTAQEVSVLQQSCGNEVLNRTERIVSAEILFRMIVGAQALAQKIDTRLAVADAVMTDQQQFMDIVGAQPHESHQRLTICGE